MNPYFKVSTTNYTFFVQAENEKTAIESGERLTKYRNFGTSTKSKVTATPATKKEHDIWYDNETKKMQGSIDEMCALCVLTGYKDNFCEFDHVNALDFLVLPQNYEINEYLFFTYFSAQVCLKITDEKLPIKKINQKIIGDLFEETVRKLEEIAE